MALRLWGGALAVGAALALGGAARAERFDFVAIGDTAYNPSVDYPVYEALIERITTHLRGTTLIWISHRDGFDNAFDRVVRIGTAA